MEGTWNSSESLGDTSTFTYYAFDVFHAVANSILFLFGVPGNSLILRVYWTKSRKTSTHILIMALAWADLVTCLLRSTAVAEGILRLVGADEQAVVLYFWPAEFMAIGTSVVITTIIAADRYDCICRPQRRYFTPRRGKIAVGLSLVIAFGASIPAFLRVADFANQDLFKLQMAFQTVAFAIALMTIAVCYGQVYATIRRHVRVGVALRPTQEGSSQLDNCSTSRGSHTTTVAVSTFDVDETNTTCGSRPSTSQVNPGVRVTKLGTVKMTAVPRRETVGKMLTPEQLEHPMLKDVTGEKDPQASVGNRDNGEAPNVTDHGIALQRKGAAAVLQRKTTRMLFITSVVFLLTWTPYFIWFGMELAEAAGAAIGDISWNIAQELLVAVYVNNAVNPLIYGLANRRFRQDCRAVLQRSKLFTCTS